MTRKFWMTAALVLAIAGGAYAQTTPSEPAQKTEKAKKEKKTKKPKKPATPSKEPAN